MDAPKNIIVGKAYIKAYQLEKLAKYPRVLVDPVVIPQIAEDKSGFLSYVNDNKDLIDMFNG
jgi:hypothetical protein